MKPTAAAIATDVAALLERRAARLRAPEPDEREKDVLFVAELAVGDSRFAFHLDQLRAAAPLRLVTGVPLSPPHVVGIFSWQGQVLCVHSLAALLGVRGWRVDPAVVVILEPIPGRLIAVDCEHVPQAKELDRHAVTGARARQASAILEIDVMPRPIHLVDDIVALVEPSVTRAD